MAVDLITPFTVTRPLKHDGETYEAGDAVDLDAEEDAHVIEHLTAGGAIVAVTETPRAGPDEDPPRGGKGGEPEATPEERMAAIIEAIAALDPDDDAPWSKGGEPRVKALEAALGFDITAVERDRAWETVNANDPGGG